MSDSGNRHIIKKQILEIEVPGQERAQWLQEQAGQFFQDKLLPIIQRVLDRHSPPNTLHRIDQLEIDLGEVKLEAFEKEVEERFLKIFEKKFKEALHKAESTPSSENQEFSDKTGFSQKTPRSRQPSQKKNGSKIDVFFYFLKNGRLPWWVETRPAFMETLVSDVLETEGDRQPFVATLKRFIQKETYRKRLIGALSDESLLQVAGLFFSKRTRTEPEARLELLLRKSGELASLLKTSEASLRYTVWETLLSLMAQGTSLRQVQQILTQQLQLHLLKKEGLNKNAIDKAFKDAGIIEILASSSAKEPSRQEKTEGEDHTELFEEKKEAVPEKSTASQRFHQSDEIYVNNAGLVLLWPFLEKLMEHLGWLKERKFKSDRMQHRAVGLLEYLASGNAAAPEYELPLNKLICGLEPEEVLEIQDPFSQEELELGDELLDAVISYATALGNISVEGFQTTFLQREGVLIKESGQWALTVKRESLDVLLDRIGWNFNAVTFPWMTSIIIVEW